MAASSYADLYGGGDRGVVLAHGGRFNKESWKDQALALERAGFRVPAIDFRGYDQSRGPGQSDQLGAPLQFDVLAAVRYLRQAGVKAVSAVGGSMGGGAPPDKIKGRKLLIIAGDDTSGSGLRLPRVQADYHEDKGTQEIDHPRKAPRTRSFSSKPTKRSV